MGRLRLHALLICGMLPGWLFAQRSVEITDRETREGVADAYVTIQPMQDSDYSLILVTNAQGKAEFDDPVPTGQKWIVAVTHVGYKPHVDTINPTQRYTAVLEPNNFQLQEVVITGQYEPGNTAKSVMPVRTIDQQKIEAMGATHLEQVLSNELNIRLSQDPILGRGMSMQGLSGENVKILIDGVPVIGRQNGNIDLAQLNLADIERIEVVEGPMAVQYGTNALAGTINIITKKSGKDGWQGNASLYAENNGTYNISGLVGLKRGRHNVRLNIGRHFFDGWSPGDAFLPNWQPTPADTNRVHSWNPRDQYFGRLQYRFQIKDFYLGSRTEGFVESIMNRGMPRAPYYELAFDDYYQTQRFDQAFTLNGKVGKGQYLDIVAAYNNYQRIKNTYLKDLTTLEQTLTSTPGDQDTSRFVQWMSRGSYAHRMEDKWYSYEFGYHVQWEQGRGGRIGDGMEKMGDFALFGTAKFEPVNNLVLKPGLRYAHNTIYDAPLIPSFHVRYKSGAFTWRGSYARGFRAPSLKELYFYFVDVNHNIVGNEDLLAEYGNNYTASINWHKASKTVFYRAELSGFYNTIENRITLAQVSNDEYSYVNIGNFRTLGGKLRLEARSQHFTVQIGGGLIGRYNELENQSVVPEYSYSPEITGMLQYQWSDPKLTTSLFYKYQGRLPGYVLDGNEVMEQFVDPYHMVDLTVSRPFWKGKLDVALGMKNLLNVQDVNAQITGTVHTAGAQAVPVGMGRVLFIRLNLGLPGNE